LPEVADVFVVNEVDRASADAGVTEPEAKEQAPAAPVTPPIVETVARTSEGVDWLWEAASAHHVESPDVTLALDLT
jgi:putative protein kinase ArgK-like GTPase of G3E family